MKYIWQPEYVGKFRCQGDKCKAKCCKCWRIHIDDESFNNYKKLEKKYRDKILSAIVEDNNMHIIKHNEKGECPLICEDNMCYIQRNLGEENLSIVCKNYPRYLISLDRIPIHLLSMSCPIALENAVFNHDGMNLKKIYKKNLSMAWREVYKINKDIFKIRLQKKVEESIVIGSVRILQNKNYKWEERLILLGLFLDRANEMITLRKADIELSKLVDVYLSEQFYKQANLFFASFVYDNKEGRKLIQELFLLSEAIVVGDVSKIKENILLCDREYDRLNSVLFEEWGTVIENYFVQEFLCGKYPFRFEKGIMHNYFVFLLLYKEFEYNLYNIILEKGSISKNNIIKLIDYFVTLTDHGNYLKNTIEKFVFKFESDPLNFMQLIIRYKHV